MIALILIMLVAYKFTTAKSFTRCTAIFIFCNFIFLGVIIGFCMIFKSNYICVKNSVVYFDVSAIQLLGCSLVAYLVSTVIIRLHNKSLSKDEIYTLVIENNASAVTLFAFVDTGNRLTEPFSNAPVIIVDRKKVEPIADVSTLRIIPTKTVNCNSLLKAFKPDKVTIKSSNHQEVLDNVYIALSDEINDDNFSAILNPNILNV
jgi:stage II sporulation protein GA (sporulation sigma-E factor processing peptidase)